MEFTRALVLGATGGIGGALARALSPHGSVTGLSRRDGLDWTDPPRAEAVPVEAARAGPFDLILNATGALQPGGKAPEKKLAALDAAAMAAQFAVNAIGPALLLKHHDALLPRETPCVLATVGARGSTATTASAAGSRTGLRRLR